MESSLLFPVDPVRPVAPYVGGKRNLARTIVSLINSVPHASYCEPFVGMGGIFLRRDRRPKCEIINDASGDVANLFRILQRHYPQFMEVLKFQITSRAEFERLKRFDGASLTDLERAARFLYVQSIAFGGLVATPRFGTSLGRPARFDLTRLAPQLADLHERLAGVSIENLDFEAFLTRYDRSDTLFYCDPPYWGTEDYYGKALFQRADFERLAEALRNLKGRFILSLNDRPEVRSLFAWADVQSVEVFYGVSGKGQTAAKEVIIRG